MTEDYLISREIVEEHESRMQQLKKYYPFFKITEDAFLQFKEGKYKQLDMGYILMAVLRFFIEENNFKEKDVTFEELEQFLSELYRMDFQLNLDKTEEKELSSYIFDKIKNDGKPFIFVYFEPKKRTGKHMRIRLIEGHIEGESIYYSITTDGIEFYLDTKEIKEESNISIEQMLLEKMIRSRNFKGGAQVIRRINNEVKKLKLQKKEVLSILNQDIFGGMDACETFMERTTKWFEEEQKLFEKNSELIRQALSKAKQDEQTGNYNSQYYRAIEEIYMLENELQRALQKHRELMRDCMDLQQQADLLVSRAKIRSLHSSFDFERFGLTLMELDRADKLGDFVKPLLKPKMKKTFSFERLDDLLNIPTEREEPKERISPLKEEVYIFEDELEEERILHNYQAFFSCLLNLLCERKTLDLVYFIEQLKARFGEQLVYNADFYSFCVQLCQKQYYCLKELENKKETILEEALARFLELDNTNKRRFQNLAFHLEMKTEQTIALNKQAEISNILFRAV